ncbi:serine/threonine-protein kinase [Aporhodopirellula aestuarii]|uniref:non-specific serine/threonine protein kinase n=1 Tax=Aporhodopirellula aestuarii TaxID=2950107 RepID=A0ABT0U8L9_9BACT|nr:serine/threonine-protein kinase [Aporhodopirellula aestuarii]MCM2373259.1 serine/threonine protein kinase [Aporhodopirellula aestuarii]
MNFTHSPNETVLDRYTINRGIGIGGFGEVYFALSQAGKEVALKRIQRNLDVELRGVSHCLNLKHPNLVSLHDICRDKDDQAWVVMEYVAGKNLREVLDEADPSGRICRATVQGGKSLPSGLTMDEVRRWFCGMAAGTAHLHSAGLVHRDLKPGNLFDDNGIIKVGDYGLSKFISSSHRSGHTESVGTLHYMAPEIGRGQYGREIDIYAMGIILFELLTGALPFDGETPQEIVVKHLTDTPDLSTIPKELRPAIAACLQKNPKDRPSDIASMMKLTPWANDVGQPMTWSSNPHGSLAQNPPTVTAQPIPQPASVEAPVHVTQPAAHTPSPHVVLSHPTTEEPIARAIRMSFGDLSRWWQNLERSPGSKFVMVLATVVILLINTHWLLPMLSLIGFFYIPYYVIRHIVLQIAEPDTYAHTHPGHDRRGAHFVHGGSPGHPQNGMNQGGATPVTRRRSVPAQLSKAQVRQMLRQSLAQRTKLSLAAEWTTSGMISLVVAGTLLLISSVIGLRNSEVSPLTIAPYVWMACVVWLGSFGLLGLGKAWESSEGDGFTRRLMAAFLGAGIGVVAYMLADVLMVPLDQGLSRDIDATSLPTTFYQASGIPKAAAMMAHFAALFALLRMWKPVDPLRRARLSLWAVSVAVVGEWVIHQMIPVPQPAGMLIAGGIVVMTQMSAPWVKADSVTSLNAS